MPKLSDLVQRRSFGFAGDEGALFDEMDYQNRLASLANPRTITNASLGQNPQNYIQRTGGQRIDVGPSMQEGSYGGAQGYRDPQGNITTYTQSGEPVTMSGREIANIKAQAQAEREFRNLQNQAMIKQMQEKAGALNPTEQLAREKFEWEKTRAGTEGPKLTEGQAKATTFASQMAAASNELDKLEAGGFNPASFGTQLQTKMAGGLGNIMTSPEAQQAKQTQNQWSEAFLRVKTGAAATEPEVQLNNKTFFPQIGDSPEVIEQKRRMRVQAENDVLNMTGGGRELATQRQAQKPSGNFDADKEARYQAWKAQQGR